MPDHLTPHNTPLHRRRFVVIIAGILSCVILACYGARYFYQQYLERNWNSVVEQDEHSIVNEVQARFSAYQERTIAATESLANSPSLISALRLKKDSALVSIFSELAVQNRMNLSFELYDGQHRLAAWSGIHSSEFDSTNFTPSVSTKIVPGPILSYFVTVIPFGVDSLRYHVIGKRLFDVNYPISNRFISNQAFATTFTSRFPFDVEFGLSPPETNNGEQRIGVPLVSLSRDTLGYLYVQSPVLLEYQDTAHEYFETIISTSVVALLLLALYLFARFQGTMRSPLFKALLWTIGIWLLRYVMLWRNFPQCLVDSTLFDASYFASPFGRGLAQSVADMCISAIFLLSNIVLIVYPWLSRFVGKERPGSMSINKYLALVLLVVLSLLIFLSLRGFVATMSSAVLDSALPYDDPTYVLPSLELMVMLISLICITLSLVILCAALGTACCFLIGLVFPGAKRPLTLWIATGGAIAGLGLLFGYFSENPLLTQMQRVSYVIVLVGVSCVLYRLGARYHRLMLFRSFLITIAVAIVFLIPLLDDNVHKLDRIHAELLSSEVLRPPDTWINIVMQRALDELSNGEAAAALSAGSRQIIEKLAFTQWAKSILSREGNNCAIVVFDRSGYIVSNFQIGISPYKSSEPFIDISPMHRYLDIEEKTSSGEKRFMGYSPIFAPGGEFLGGVWVELAAGRQSVLNDETINLLKNYSGEHFETHYRKISISEYLQGKLISTTDESIPLEHRLPPDIRERDVLTLWLDETIDGASYETLYLRDQSKSAGDVWIALRMSSLDLRWHLFSYLRYVLFYVMFVSAICVILLLTHVARGRALRANFKIKLMTAFMIVSIIPVIVLAYYNRQYVLDRVGESTEKRLNDQTALVLSAVQREFEASAPFTLSQVTNTQCTSVADRVDADFIIYNDKYLQASSKPEIFTAELLDERLSADAYVNLMLKKKRFYAENRSIGSFPYIVGYRPITSESGTIIGAVSVPTLFRESEIDEELTQRNVLLFGAYALALLLSIGVGTLFANQISLPILRLKDATKRIAKGDWNVHLRSGRKDELGELEQSFEEMAKNLEHSQEQMLAAQREAAWKEMAKQVAHEIKNPLTPIKLSIQHLRRAYTDNVKDFSNVLHQVSSTILQQIETLTRIASEFSHFARMPERKLAYCDVHEILDEARNLFGQHKSVAFMTEYHAQKSIILVDREELRRAFINIIRNAIQAMKEKGAMTLRTTSDVDIIEIHMTDTGPGIPPEIRDRLFEPNFSTKTDGMGLGLSIVKKTVDDLGGTIAIDSAPGAGTTVIIKLLLSLEHE